MTATDEPPLWYILNNYIELITKQLNESKYQSYEAAANLSASDTKFRESVAKAIAVFLLDCDSTQTSPKADDVKKWRAYQSSLLLAYEAARKLPSGLPRENLEAEILDVAKYRFPQIRRGPRKHLPFQNFISQLADAYELATGTDAGYSDKSGEGADNPIQGQFVDFVEVAWSDALTIRERREAATLHGPQTRNARGEQIKRTLILRRRVGGRSSPSKG